MCYICRDLRAFLGVKFGLEDLLRVKDLTFRNSAARLIWVKTLRTLKERVVSTPQTDTHLPSLSGLVIQQKTIQTLYITLYITNTLHYCTSVAKIQCNLITIYDRDTFFSIYSSQLMSNICTSMSFGVSDTFLSDTDWYLLVLVQV